MQATLDASSLKPFTKALTCLSKYSDDLQVFATPERLLLSATNSSESAYCSFRYTRQFFSRYSISRKDGPLAGAVEEVPNVTGQLLTKSLLAILKHRTFEKTVDKCELSIVEGVTPDSEQEETDSLETKLVVRLYCKHGVTKTHRLPLHDATSTHTFNSTPNPTESRLSIGPKALKDMMEHFPSVKGNRGDPQLIWSFGDSEVQIKSLETSIDTRGKAQLATELMISAAEFETYEIYDPPTTLAFQLREFNATVSFADSVLATLNFRFTEPAEPLVIELDSDDTDSIFAISTSQVHPVTTDNTSQQLHHVSASASKKRQRDEDDASTTTPRPSAPPSGRRKPMKVVRRQDVQTVARSLAASDSQQGSRSMPPPSLPLQSQQELEYTQGTQTHFQPYEEPLFLQGSQLSAANEELIRSAGLGIENMTAEEVVEMMECEGEEYEMPPTQQEAVNGFEELFDDAEMEPTQKGLSGSRGFKPLFED